MRHRSARTASAFSRRSAGIAIILPLLLTLLLSACNGSDSAGANQPITLNVFAAASLQAAFTDIGAAFHSAHPNVTVTFNFGGSDALATQINQGAPADVFASANITQMNVAVTGGQITSASVQTFAHNRLVVIYPKGNPAHITSLQDLATPGVKLILAAQAVPVGQYALAFLTKASADPSFGANYKDAVLKNVVSYEADVKSVLTKVALGEADAGIVYVTDAQTKADSVATIDIPDALNSIAVYPIALVKDSQHAAVAQQFISAVLSAQGQATLAKYGFVAGSSGPQYTPPTGA